MLRIFAAVALCFYSLTTGVCQAKQPAAKRPNILFILADDQSPFDLKIYNPDSKLDTPTLDRLATRGMVIDGAYHMGSWSGAVCTPSRHMIMCGRSVWHLPAGRPAKSGTEKTENEFCPPDLAEYTLAAVFNRAGYDTMRTCKKGNSYPAANAKFTVLREATKRGGNDQSGSAWHCEQVLDYLNQRETEHDANPFLIYFGFSHPHDTRDGKPELLAKYGATNHAEVNSLPPANPLQPALPINWLPKHPFDHGHPNLRDEVNVSGVWKNRDEQTIRNELGREFACSENIDTQIDRVLKKLESLGQLENTVVIYTADHGMAIGRHGLQGKQNLYQHTWRVPMIVAGPGIVVGKRAVGNVYLMDMLATICDLANVPSPETNEGISLVPVLRGEKETIRETMYGVYCGGTKPGMRCVQQGDWKLIKYDVLKSSVQQTQMFNLAENPHEFLEQHHDTDVVEKTGLKLSDNQRNLADDPQFAGKRAELEALLLNEMQRLDDPYRLWDQPRK